MPPPKIIQIAISAAPQTEHSGLWETLFALESTPPQWRPLPPLPPTPE